MEAKAGKANGSEDEHPCQAARVSGFSAGWHFAIREADFSNTKLSGEGEFDEIFHPRSANPGLIGAVSHFVV